MPDYSRIFGSTYPYNTTEIGTRKNISNDAEVVSLFLKYNQFIEDGDFTNANKLYNLNKDKLEPYIVDEKYLNRLEEDIYNVWMLAISKIKSIQSESEPFAEIDSYWIKEY